MRQKALQKFLTRLADHPVVSFDKNFQVFLTAKAWVSGAYSYRLGLVELKGLGRQKLMLGQEEIRLGLVEFRFG